VRFFLTHTVGTRSGVRCDMPPSRIITDYHQNEAFSLMKLMYSNFEVMCRMGRRSFWSWFDVNRSRFDEDFCSQWPWPTTFRPQTCSPIWSSSALCFD